jgi:hypothetical protein
MSDPKLIYSATKVLALTGKKINIAVEPIPVNVFLNYTK